MDDEHVSLRKKALRHIRKLGLQLSEKPEDKKKAQLPEDPTRLGPIELQRYQTAMVAWGSYAGENLALLRADLIEARGALRKKKARIRAMLSGSNTPKWQIEDKIEGNPKVRALIDRVDILEAQELVLAQIAIGYDAKSKVLSRDQTRRQGEYDRAPRS